MLLLVALGLRVLLRLRVLVSLHRRAHGVTEALLPGLHTGCKVLEDVATRAENARAHRQHTLTACVLGLLGREQSTHPTGDRHHAVAHHCRSLADARE